MNTNFDIDAAMRDLLLLAAAEELRATPAADPQVTPAYQKKFAQMQADPFGYAKRLNRPFKRRLQRAAIAAVLLLAVIFGTIMAIPQTRTIAINILTQWYDKYIAFIFVGETDNITLPDIEINYLPEGYELVYASDISDEVRKVLEYRDMDNHILSINIFTAHNRSSFNIDSEHRKLEYVKMNNGLEGQLFKADDEDLLSYLLWSSPDGQIFFSIGGSLPEDELLNIADGIVMD